jgi:hypothetical protein
MEAYSHDNDCIAFPSVFVNVQQHLAGGYHCTGVPAANHFQTRTLIFVPCFATWRNVLTLLQIMYPAWATVRRIALFFFLLCFGGRDGVLYCKSIWKRTVYVQAETLIGVWRRIDFLYIR